MLITISREFGSGGRELGKRLADALSIPCYDNEIIHFVAEQGGFDSNFIAHAGERSMKAFYPGTIASRLMVQPVNSLASLKIEIVSAQQKILRGFAESGDCVIVGRAADIILEDFRPFNIFVHASMASWIERTLARQHDGENLTAKEAERKIKEIDKHRASYRSDFTQTKWGDKANYHLCINTTDIEIKKIIPALVNYIRIWSEKEKG